MLSTSFKSDTGIEGKSTKGGLRRAIQNRQYLTAYRRQSEAISLESYLGALFVQFGKANQLRRFSAEKEKLMNVVLDEHAFLESVIMPFLREHWDFIDRPEPNSGERDGRLTKDELVEAYQQALRSNRILDAFILNELLMRYEPICHAYEDGYWCKDETVLGISEEDVSVYEQTVAPNYRKRNGRPQPKPWF